MGVSVSVVGDNFKVSVDEGEVAVGNIAVAGDHGTATSGWWEPTTTGRFGRFLRKGSGTAVAGDFGTAVAGDFGTAKVGAGGKASTGEGGKASAGVGGLLIFGSFPFYIFLVGIDPGVLPDVMYTLDSENKPIEYVELVILKRRKF